MNKNGWGLRVELAFLLFFLICLLIATIGLHRMGLLGNNGVYEDDGYIYDNVNYDYDALEKKVTEAAGEYYKSAYNSKSNDTISFLKAISSILKLDILIPLFLSKYSILNLLIKSNAS